MITAARSAGLPPSCISPLMVGIAAPLLVTPLLLLWLARKVTYEELAALILRTVSGWLPCRPEPVTHFAEVGGA